MRIDQFEMERMRSIHWHCVDYGLSEGSALTRERMATWYPGATAENATVVNGGPEANPPIQN